MSLAEFKGRIQRAQLREEEGEREREIKREIPTVQMSLLPSRTHGDSGTWLFKALLGSNKGLFHHCG